MTSIESQDDVEEDESHERTLKDDPKESGCGKWDVTGSLEKVERQVLEAGISQKGMQWEWV